MNESIPGSLDDARRAEVTRFYTEMLPAAGFGWMGWALREGKAISTRRDRYDSNGLNGEGFHSFFTKAGKLHRAGVSRPAAKTAARLGSGPEGCKVVALRSGRVIFFRHWKCENPAGCGPARRRPREARPQADNRRRRPAGSRRTERPRGLLPQLSPAGFSP